MIRMLLRAFVPLGPSILLACAAMPAGAALPPAPGRAIVISAPAGGPAGWGHVMFDPALGIDPRKLPGDNARDFTVLPGAGVDTVSAVLVEAEAQGAAGCDTVPAFVGRPQVWDVAWYSPMPGGGFRCARRTRISLGALRCRALAHRVDPTGPPHTLAQVALDTITRIGGPAYAMGPPPEHGGPNPEIGRILDRSALVRDARSASPLRDWNSLALDLRMDDAAAGRAARLSVTDLPPSPAGASDAAWIRVPPGALRRALLAFLPRGPIELAARRPRRLALRDGVCGRYAVTLWDSARQVSTLVDDAYLTPLEMDSLARDVADAIAHGAPDAARALRVQLGITGRRPQPSALAALPAAAREPRDPVAIRLAPSEGDEFVRPVVYRLAGVPDSALEARFGRRINRADEELTLVGGWLAQDVSPRTMHALAAVLARAAAEDDAGLGPAPTPPAWPPLWRATLLDAAPGGAFPARATRALPTWRIRGRAREWADHLPGDAEDDTRRVLADLVDLGLPPARQFRGVGEDPPAPALPTPEAERESLRVAARAADGLAFLGVSFWFHAGAPHPFADGVRLVAGDRAAVPPGTPVGGLTLIGEPGLRELITATLDDPDLAAGAHRAYEDMARGDAFLEARIVERRHGGNPTRLLWVSFLDRVSGARAVELLAHALAATEPDVAADLHRRAETLRTGDSGRAAPLRRGS